LNWNGWQDTVECLESVLKLEYEKFNVILIDNNSGDNSVVKIKNWANGITNDQINTKFPELIYPLVSKPIKFIELSADYDLSYFDSILENKEIVFLKNSTNVGFAVANNQGMVIAAKLFKSKYYYLLNNDTVIEKWVITDLVDKLEQDDTISVAQSTIYSYEDRGKIVHAGGRILFWGQTKHYKQINKNEIRKIFLINGCALLIREEVIRIHGYLSEKFFFGEEDFELSARFNKRRLKMICSGASRIYHKVGISSKKLMGDYEKSVVLFALNRTVDLKYFYPTYIWYFWRIPAQLYFSSLLWIKYKVPLKRTIYLMKNVCKYSSRIDDVKKNTVDKIFKEMELD
jgi:GT2 family glycosyltransferase